MLSDLKLMLQKAIQALHAPAWVRVAGTVAYCTWSQQELAHVLVSALLDQEWK